MVLGCVPFLKRLIFTPDAPLYFFTDSCMILGYVYFAAVATSYNLFCNC